MLRHLAERIFEELIEPLTRPFRRLFAAIGTRIANRFRKMRNYTWGRPRPAYVPEDGVVEAQTIIIPSSVSTA